MLSISFHKDRSYAALFQCFRWRQKKEREILLLVLAGEGWAVGHLCCLTGSQALGQERGQCGRRHSASSPTLAYHSIKTRRKSHQLRFGVGGELKTFISWESLRSRRWEGWKCCRERTLEVQAGGPTGTMGRPSWGQAGSERVQSWDLHNRDLRDRKRIHRKLVFLRLAGRKTSYSLEPQLSEERKRAPSNAAGTFLSLPRTNLGAREFLSLQREGGFAVDPFSGNDANQLGFHLSNIST